MTEVTIHEAKTHLFGLLLRVEGGEERRHRAGGQARRTAMAGPVHAFTT